MIISHRKSSCTLLDWRRGLSYRPWQQAGYLQPVIVRAFYIRRRPRALGARISCNSYTDLKQRLLYFTFYTHCVWLNCLANHFNAEATFIQITRTLRKPSKPFCAGVHCIALTENFHLSTHVPGFQSTLRFFTSFSIGQISHQQHKG